MLGRFYIDGKDAFTGYGVNVAEAGYNELMAFPPLKSVSGNEWQEEDGIEADLSAPVLNTREFSMKFACTGTTLRYGAFIELLSDQAYHEFDFREIGRSFRLRMVSHTALDLVDYLGVLTLRLADDFPLEGYTYADPTSTISPHESYELDGRLFTDYGVRVLEGTLDEIRKSPAVKKNLLRNIGSKDGAMYDGKQVTFDTKDVKVNCLLRADTLDEMWRNYNALLYDLTRPDERILYCDATGEEYPCYYKSCAVIDFAPTSRVWLEFTLTLVFTSFRVGADEFILTSEDGEWIMTEDEEYAIDLEEDKA